MNDIIMNFFREICNKIECDMNEHNKYKKYYIIFSQEKRKNIYCCRFCYVNFKSKNDVYHNNSAIKRKLRELGDTFIEVKDDGGAKGSRGENKIFIMLTAKILLEKNF